MKKYLFFLTAALFAVIILFTTTPAVKAEYMPETIEEADKSFDDRLYSQAIEAYKPFLKSKKADIKYKAQLKTVMAYYNQYKYDEALKNLYLYEVPSNDTWKARYYLLKYYLLTENRYDAPTVEESETDPLKFTQLQKETVAKQVLTQLWDMRKKLAYMPYKDNKDYLIDTNMHYDFNIPLAVKYPTLFDYTIPLWQSAKTKPLEEIYEQAYTIKGADRETAMELWHLKRVDLIEPQQGQDPLLTRTARILYIAGLTQDYPKDANVKKYIFKAKEPMVKAYAAYYAADLYKQADLLEESVSALDYCLQMPLNSITHLCEQLRQSITEPYLSFGNTRDIISVAPEKDFKLNIDVRNIDKYYIHIFKLNPPNKKTNFSVNIKDIPQTPLRTLTVSVSYGRPYEHYNNDIIVPGEKPGFYLVVLNTEKDFKNFKKASLAYNSYIVVNSTDIALVATAYANPKNLSGQTSYGNFANIYSIDAQTGLAKPSVKIESNLTPKPAYTSKEGFLSLAKNKNDKDFHLEAFGSLNGNYAVIPALDFYKTNKDQYLLALNTDMAVYKAGSMIKAQITAAELDLTQGYKLAEGKSVKIKLYSPNGTVLNEKTVNLDSMGSAAYYFQLPKETMLGNYELNAEIGQYHTLADISVEAFKAPEFKVNFSENKEPIQYGVPFEVQGRAIYYYGLNTAEAKVKYTVSKRTFHPLISYKYPYSEEQTVQRGETYTDKSGIFKITFTPTITQEGFPLPEIYTIDATVTDMAGNSIVAQTQYTLSAKTKFFHTEKTNNFFRNDRQSVITVKMQDIEGKPLNGSATVNIYSATTPRYWDYNTLDDNNVINQLTKNKLIRSQKLDFKDGQPALITIPPLKEGWYITEFIPEGQEEPDPNDNDVFLVVNMKDPSVNLPYQTILPEEKTYYPGETAVILLASPEAKGNKYVEVYKDEFLVHKATLTNEGAAILQMPVLPTYAGGIDLRWFSVYDYTYYTGNAKIDVPYPQSNLKLTLSGDKTSFPGAKKSLKLNVADNKDNPVDARAIITVYDAAIDYYREHSLHTINPYSNYTGFNPIESSFTIGHSYGITQLNMARGALKSSAEMTDTIRSVGEDNEGYEQNQIRSDFNSNALWLSALNVKKGKASFAFTLPQNIGQWKVLAAAFTKNLQTGKTDFGFITKKDIILSLEAPRFLRNGDDIQLKALISNTTDMAISAQVKLTASYDCEEESEDCLTKEYPSISVIIPPQGQDTAKWNFKAPQDGSYIMFSATAKSGVANDGEIKTVPLLPSKQQLTASTTVALKKGPNKIDLDDIEIGAELEAVHLTVSPSLLMPVINAMPLLVKTNNTMATYVADSYLPLAIFDKIYSSYPQIKQAVAQLPQRETISPAWNLDEKLLINDITQSPWYMLSKGFNNTQDIINLFDPEIVEKHKKQAEKDLASFQNQDGGYAWIKGGKSSTFITLNVLESFAQARRYGIEIDEQAAKKALNYLIEEKSRDNTDIYRAYIYTSFPQEWNDKTYQIAQDAMREFEINPRQTPVNYAYAAMTYKNLGDIKKANLQLNRMFDLANNSEVSGTSWSFEDRSWQWFEDDINLHATALKAVYQNNPNDERIQGLVKWLIFNEKSQAWGNPQNAAKAVYALLQVMLDDPSMEVEKVFTTDWNLPYSEKEKMRKIRVKPFALDSKLTLSAYGSEITENALNAVITKAVFTNKQDLLDIDDYATLTALFTSDTPQRASKNGLIYINKSYYLIKDGKASLLKNNDTITPGDDIQVRLKIKADSAFDFIVISDPKPSAFENNALLSGWKYQQLYRYEELKDNVTNFFIPYLPKGTYELNYTMHPTSAGQFTNGAAVIQSMFMPEITAHSEGFKVKVR